MSKKHIVKSKRKNDNKNMSTNDKSVRSCMHVKKLESDN